MLLALVKESDYVTPGLADALGEQDFPRAPPRLVHSMGEGAPFICSFDVSMYSLHSLYVHVGRSEVCLTNRVSVWGCLTILEANYFKGLNSRSKFAFCETFPFS